MTTRVVHCKREPYDVYIGRGSKWGNPFKIGPDGSRADVIAKYCDYIGHQRTKREDYRLLVRPTGVPR